jgi:uncharacterized membrane protein
MIARRRLRAAEPLLRAGALLGCGLGALFDGILLHQILQWHNLLSSVEPPVDLIAMKYNMLWDGLFHAFAWIVTAMGVLQLLSAGGHLAVRWSRAAFFGSALAGWGAFNLLEGLIDHQWLALHHVHPGHGQLAWDIAFLAWGATMLVGGIMLARRTLVPRSRATPAYGQY